jgi:hypothetical protein
MKVSLNARLNRLETQTKTGKGKNDLEPQVLQRLAEEYLFRVHQVLREPPRPKPSLCYRDDADRQDVIHELFAYHLEVLRQSVREKPPAGLGIESPPAVQQP